MSFESEFDLVPLGDVASFINGDRSSNYPKASDYVANGIPFISAADLSDGRIQKGSVKRITTAAYDRLRNGKINHKDVLFCLRGSIGKLAYVFPQEVGAIASSLVIVRATKKIDDRYLYFILCSTAGQQAATSLNNGSAQPNLSVGELQKVLIPLPPVNIQRAIAATLDSLDDRITLLRETNQTLEAIAQALFKSWFVDFDSVRAKAEGKLPEDIDAATAALFPDAFEESELGLVPKGWVIGRLIDFAKLKGGKMLSKEHFSVDGEFPVYGGAGEMGRSDLSNAEGFVITVGRVGAYCGQYFWHSGKAWVNNNASQVIPHNVNYSVWLYQWLRSVDMDLIKKGAAQPFVSNGDIENLQIILPSASVIEEFVIVCEPLFERMSSVLASISTLTNLRDTLLPRLISGQLRIAEAELEKATA